MKARRGQALIIVVIIIAIVSTVFVRNLFVWLNFHSREETEIYQREEALYLAETGINKMIFNINSGVNYLDGDSISANVPGIGSYEAIYHTPDDPFYGGSAYIESTGTVGEITRKVFASVMPSGSKYAFKYCLFTSTGGRDGIARNYYFTNYIYGNAYKYNRVSSFVPIPDRNFYSPKYAEKTISLSGATPEYDIEETDLGKVLFIHTEDPDASLTVSFVNIYDASYKLSVITDAKNVTFDKMGPANGYDTNWYGAENSLDNNLVYPILVHLGTGTATFKFDYFYDGGTTLYLHGFVYTRGGISMSYISSFIYGNSYGEFDGEVMEGNPVGELGGQYGDTEIEYVTDYYTNPPPHFILPDNVVKVLPGSFREEF